MTDVPSTTTAAPAVEKSALMKAHDYTAGKLFKFVGGLFMEQKGENGEWVASAGRVMLWLVFGHLMIAWTGGKSPDATELNAFYALLAYQGVKVGKDAVSDSIGAWKGQ